MPTDYSLSFSFFFVETVYFLGLDLNRFGKVNLNYSVLVISFDLLGVHGRRDTYRAEIPT